MLCISTEGEEVVYGPVQVLTVVSFFLPSRDVAHISTCDDGCLALADLLGWKVSYKSAVTPTKH